MKKRDWWRGIETDSDLLRLILIGAEVVFLQSIPNYY